MIAFQAADPYFDTSRTVGGLFAMRAGAVGFLATALVLRRFSVIAGLSIGVTAVINLIWTVIQPGRADPLHFTQFRNQLITAGLCFIPWVGFLAAGIFAKKCSPHVLDSGVHGCVEAFTETLFIPFRGLIKRWFFPLSGRRRMAHYSQPLDTRRILIPVTRIDRKTQKLFRSSIECFASSKTNNWKNGALVMFHGNCETAQRPNGQEREYVAKGFNVFRITLGGYPTQELDVGPPMQTTEGSIYQDADAIIQYVKELGCRSIAVHGTSLGAVPAFAAAVLHPDVVKIVIADRAFSRSRDVVANVVKNLFASMGLAKWVPTSIYRGIGGAGFPIGIQTAGIPLPIDGMDNRRKASLMKARLITVESTDDEFMSVRPWGQNFSQDLLRARYMKQIPDGSWQSEAGTNPVRLPLTGGHNVALPQDILVDALYFC